MKIAFDVDVIKHLPITQMVRQVSEWGYKYIEQSPHPRINPFYKHPKAGRETMQEYKRALQNYGVEISSFIVVYRWSGPDEERRRAAVTNWKRMIEIAVDMGVQVINGLAPIFPYTFYHLTHYWFAAADIPVANDTPVHYADAIRCNVRRPPQGSLPLLTRRVSA